MAAIHEDDTRPQHHVRAPSTRTPRPVRCPHVSPDASDPTRAFDDVDLHSPRTPPRGTAPTTGTSRQRATRGPREPSAWPTRQVDTVLAHYFGDVRRFALLSVAEEQALGRRIIRGQRRVRWALSTAPMALPTLRRLWPDSRRFSPWRRAVPSRAGATSAPRTAREHDPQACARWRSWLRSAGVWTTPRVRGSPWRRRPRGHTATRVPVSGGPG